MTEESTTTALRSATIDKLLELISAASSYRITSYPSETFAPTAHPEGVYVNFNFSTDGGVERHEIAVSGKSLIVAVGEVYARYKRMPSHAPQT